MKEGKSVFGVVRRRVVALICSSMIFVDIYTHIACMLTWGVVWMDSHSIALLAYACMYIYIHVHVYTQGLTGQSWFDPIL